MKKFSRAKAIAAIDEETKMDITVFAEREMQGRVWTDAELAPFAERHVQRCNFLVKYGEVAVEELADALLMRSRLQARYKGKRL